MSWQEIFSLSLVMVSIAGINVAALRWMLDRHQQKLTLDNTRFADMEHSLFNLRVSLPLEYVRREDWIRFSATLDAKLDAMRHEMREEIGAIKEKLYV